MRVYGYARVSTQEQSLQLQIENIQNYCKTRGLELIEIFAEKASGKNTKDRQRFSDMIELLETNPNEIETVIVTKLDRLGRSLVDLINITTFFEKHKIQFVSISDAIDTTSMNGRLFFHMMGAIAEFERELINERTQAGILKARQSGKKFGRPRKRIDMDEVRKQIAMGIPKTRICKDLGCSKSFINKKLSEKPTSIGVVQNT